MFLPLNVTSLWIREFQKRRRRKLLFEMKEKTLGHVYGVKNTNIKYVIYMIATAYIPTLLLYNHEKKLGRVVLRIAMRKLRKK